ncbi:MAG: hypothetical protein N838_15210 [Thiohalocapsa sp. PB-PSB1]|nr:MAG: hypothetical protein N838_15210 [Thiohalocapsa sp. PB-PSB1]
MRAGSARGRLQRQAAATNGSGAIGQSAEPIRIGARVQPAQRDLIRFGIGIEKT